MLHYCYKDLTSCLKATTNQEQDSNHCKRLHRTGDQTRKYMIENVRVRKLQVIQNI